MEGESSRRVEGSGPVPDVGVSLDDQFPPDPPIMREAVVSSGDANRRVDNEGTEADDKSEVISVGVDLCQLLVGASRRESLLRRQSGELVSFQRQRLHWIRLDYRFVSFQTSQYTLTFY